MFKKTLVSKSSFKLTVYRYFSCKLDSSCFCFQTLIFCNYPIILGKWADVIEVIRFVSRTKYSVINYSRSSSRESSMDYFNTLEYEYSMYS